LKFKRSLEKKSFASAEKTLFSSIKYVEEKKILKIFLEQNKYYARVGDFKVPDCLY